MAKKKTVRKVAIKKSKGQKTVIVIKTVHSAKDTLFPEKLKKANALLKNTKFINY